MNAVHMFRIKIQNPFFMYNIIISIAGHLPQGRCRQHRHTAIQSGTGAFLYQTEYGMVFLSNFGTGMFLS
jgi:hypothetical protein